MNKSVKQEITTLQNLVRMREECSENMEMFGVPMCRCNDPSCFAYTKVGTLRPILVLTSVKWAMLLKNKAQIIDMIEKGGGILMLDNGIMIRGISFSSNPNAKKIHYTISKLSAPRTTLNYTIEDKVLYEIISNSDDILTCISSYGTFREVERLKKDIREEKGVKECPLKTLTEKQLIGL